jgi:hypothetical protein
VPQAKRFAPVAREATSAKSLRLYAPTKEEKMPTKETIRRAKADLRQGKRPSTAAGEFVREEIHHIREGKHGARSTQQAIAIGLSKARRAGVPLKPPAAGKAKTRESAERAYEVGQGQRKPRAPSRTRGKAVSRALKREPHRAASHASLSNQAKRASSRRTHASRVAAAKKGWATRREEPQH